MKKKHFTTHKKLNVYTMTLNRKGKVKALKKLKMLKQV